VSSTKRAEDPQTGVGNRLVRAAKASHIPQFGAQHCHRFESKLLHLLQTLDVWIIGDQMLDFAFQASQIRSRMLQLIAEDLQAGRSPCPRSPTPHALLGQGHQRASRWDDHRVQVSVLVTPGKSPRRLPRRSVLDTWHIRSHKTTSFSDGCAK